MFTRNLYSPGKIISSYSILFIIFILLVSSILSRRAIEYAKTTQASETTWEIQSIDTMKYSRDLAREKVREVNYKQEIFEHIKKISETGATHVAVGTPYDDEFIPYLKVWVDAARRNNLHVWFRGNHAGWEQWFNYSKIDRNKHLELTSDFLKNNHDLFENGDIFTPCPECENGGPGDPRDTGDLRGHLNFLAELYQICQQSFAQTGKDIKCGYFSMNGDVARLYMNENDANQLGGVVVIDHYTKTPEELDNYIMELAAKTNAKIMIGEIGLPIPDIHGEMKPDQQAEWLDKTLDLVSQKDAVIGINYWVSKGGSTALWSSNWEETKKVQIIKKYFTLNF